MKLKERGKFLELPIIGLTIKRLIYDGSLTIVFSDYEESYLEFHSEFKVIQYNQENTINPRDKESLMFFTINLDKQ